MLKSIWHKYFGRPDDTFEDRVRKNHGISETVTVNILLSVALVYVLGLNEYMATSKSFTENMRGLEKFLSLHYLPFILAIFTWLWFLVYRKAVRNEMEIIFRLFSQINPPHNWENLIGTKQLPLLAILIPATFLALAASVKVVPLYCIILLGLNFFDIRGNSILRQIMTAMFLDTKSAPPKDDPLSEFIIRRRAAAEAPAARVA